MEYLKKNKYMIFAVYLVIIFTPNMIFARGFYGVFHGRGHVGHFHGEYITHTFHDDGETRQNFHDEEETHISNNEDNETESLGLRVKDTFNYLIPQNWHNHHSYYYLCYVKLYMDIYPPKK